MSQEQQVQQIINQATKILRNYRVPSSKLQYFINYQMVILQNKSSLLSCCSRNSHLKEQVGEQFKRAYSTLNRKQKAQFLLLNAINIEKSINHKHQYKGQQKVTSGLDQKQYQLIINIKDDRVNKNITNTKATIREKHKIIQIHNKKQYIIDFHYYIIRRSKNKNKKFCIVLQAIEPFVLCKTIRIFFNQFQYLLYKNIIKNIWELAQFQNIQKYSNKKLINLSTQEPKVQQNYLTKQTLTSKQIQTQKNIKEENQKQFINSKQPDNSSLNKIGSENQYLNKHDSNIQKHENQVLSQKFIVQHPLRIILKVPQNKNKQQNHNTSTQNINTNNFHRIKVIQNCSNKNKDWQLPEKGGVVLINKQMIKNQSDATKFFIKRIGSKILAGNFGSVVNMSLPIIIFSKQSFLQIFARLYRNAPRFVERAAQLDNPIERMVNIVCFTITAMQTVVLSEKPFNPTFGQTYQGIIDGCPIYAEQISHHPPIGSILFYGRGYRIFGNIQPVMHLSINSAYGRFEGIHTIEFERDKSLVKFCIPGGQMSGLNFGEKHLTFIKKTGVLDYKNRIYCQLNWGKQKQGLYPQSKYHDYFQGRIVKLRQGANMDNIQKIHKEDVVEEYGNIYGRFTQSVFYNNKKIYDIQVDLPFQIQNYTPFLISDSRFRKDIIQLKNNNIQAAQQIKQEIEQIQRNDQKLRKAFNHHD